MTRSRLASRPRLCLSAWLVVLCLAGTSAAQETRSLEALAPATTILALGIAPDALPEGDLGEALAELDWEGARAAWQALAPALDTLNRDMPLPWLGAGIGAMAEVADDPPEADGLLRELEASCPDLADDLATLNDGRWVRDVLVTVSMDAFAPFPAGLAAVRVHEDALEAATALHDRLVTCFATDSAGSQDGSELHVVGDGSDLPLVLARRGNLFLAGTRPDVVRAAIRREAGAEEPSFASTRVGGASEAFESRLRLALQTDVLADVAETRLPRSGDPVMEVARTRAVAALRTFGGAALRLDLDEAGAVAETLVAFDRGGGDDDLAALLACDGCRAPGPFLAPEDAVAASGAPWRLRAWSRYLDGWLRELSGASGEATDLRTLARTRLGVDLDTALLDWVGPEIQTVRFEAFSPDLRHLVRRPATAMVMPVASSEAAQAGLRALGEAVESLLEAGQGTALDLPDPETFRAMVSVQEGSVEGTPYYRVLVGPTLEFAVGTLEDRLVLATPAAAMADVLAVHRGAVRNGFASAGWQAVTDRAPEDRVAWSYGDGGADLRGLADLLDLAAQPLAFAVSAGITASGDSDGVGGEPFVEEPWGQDGGAFGGPLDVASAERYGSLDLSDLTPRTLQPPEDVEVALTSSTLDATYLDDALTDLYRLSGLRAGDVVTVEMTSEPIDTYLYLIDADQGRLLQEVDDSPDTGRSEISFVADEDTDLWIGAGSWSGRNEGPYRLSGTRTSEEAPADEPADGPAEEDPAEAAEQAAPAPTFGELLPLFEVAPRALRLVGERLGPYVSVTTSDEDGLRTIYRQAFDW